ncbi:cupin domain-containing protein [Candidatus Poribacteria bacterium]
MQKTTLIKRRKDMIRQPLPECHGGRGALDWISVLDGADTRGKHINFIHDDILPPGASIGIHTHEHDEEYYYIVSGGGTMTLDGEQFEVSSGDITAVYPGGSHGLENDTNEDLRIIVISAS